MIESNDYLKVRHQQMNHKDRSKVMTGFLVLSFFMIVFTSMLSFFLIRLHDLVGILFSTFVFSISILVCFSFLRSTYLDLQENEKEVLQGIITDKRVELIHSKKRTEKSYQLFFGEEKQSVRKKEYEVYEIGDFIEISNARHSSWIRLGIKLLKKGEPDNSDD